MARSPNCLPLGPLGTDRRLGRQSRGHHNFVNRSKIEARIYRALRVGAGSVAVYGQTLALPAPPAWSEGSALSRPHSTEQLSSIEAVSTAQFSSKPHCEPRLGTRSTIDRHSEESDRSSPSADSAEPLQPQIEAKADINLRFGIANQEALLFTGIEPAFNIATEAGTPDALNSQWLQDYLEPLAELHGSSSDRNKLMSPSRSPDGGFRLRFY